MPLKFMSSCPSQFKEDTGESSMCAQEINPVTYLLQDKWPDQDMNHHHITEQQEL